MLLTSSDESEKRKLAAWNKALQVTRYDPANYRKDRFGSWVAFHEYGKTTAYGWEIDHIWPLGRGGLLAQSNEAALHWQNNRAKSDRFVG